MILGLLSDAHGNPMGLRLCLAAAEQQGATQLCFLGDAVGYLPGEVEVLELLASAGALCQRGNHEAMLLGALDLPSDRDEAYRLGPARSRLSRDQLDRIAGWPEHRELVIDGRRLLLVHGSPRARLTEYIYPDSDIDWMADLGYDAIFTGNTHRPFVRTIGNGVLVANVGSCGIPRDQGDLPSVAVYDSATHRCRIIRVRVPADMVLAQFADAPHPLVVESLHRRTPVAFGTVIEHYSNEGLPCLN